MLVFRAVTQLLVIDVCKTVNRPDHSSDSQLMMYAATDCSIIGFVRAYVTGSRHIPAATTQLAADSFLHQNPPIACENEDHECAVAHPLAPMAFVSVRDAGTTTEAIDQDQ